MKHRGAALALAGLALAIVLFVREDIAGVVDLLLAAGPGLIVAAIFIWRSMALNARAWQLLLPCTASSLRTLTRATWIRESVNGLLPVGRIGGEVVAYRILRRSLIAAERPRQPAWSPTWRSRLSHKPGFALLGLGLCVMLGATTLATPRLLAGFAIMIALGVAFALVQRAGAPSSAITSVLNRLFAGPPECLAITQSLRLDRRDARDLCASRRCRRVL